MLVLEESCSKTCVTVLCLRAILGCYFSFSHSSCSKAKTGVSSSVSIFVPDTLSRRCKFCVQRMHFTYDVQLPRPFFKHAPFLCQKLRTCWCRMNLIASEQLFLRKHIFFKCTFGDSSVRFAASGTQDDLEEMTGTSVTKVVTVVEACKVASLKVS